MTMQGLTAVMAFVVFLVKGTEAIPASACKLTTGISFDDCQALIQACEEDHGIPMVWDPPSTCACQDPPNSPNAVCGRGSSPSSSPTKSPVTSKPTRSPETSKPTRSPVTSKPTRSPVSSPPTNPCRPKVTTEDACLDLEQFCSSHLNTPMKFIEQFNLCTCQGACPYFTRAGCISDPACHWVGPIIGIGGHCESAPGYHLNPDGSCPAVIELPTSSPTKSPTVSKPTRSPITSKPTRSPFSGKGQCSPQRTNFFTCENIIDKCDNDFDIPMKFIPTLGLCTCEGSCPYPTRLGCNADPNCSWIGRFFFGRCVSRPGFHLDDGICPVRAAPTSRPTRSPTRHPTKFPTRRRHPHHRPPHHRDDNDRAPDHDG